MKFLITASALLLVAAPAAAQNIRITDLPPAAPITGAEQFPVSQNGSTRSATPAQIGTYLGSQFQPHDIDLDVIAALATQPFGRSLLTQPDAPSVRGAIGVTATGADATYLYRQNNLGDLGNVAAARSNLGLGSLALQPSTGVSITGGSIIGITDLAVADGGTGASTAAAARANLLAAASGPNSDITSLSGLTTALSVAQGGTGATTVAAAQSALNVSATGTDPNFAKLSGAAFTGAVSAASVSASVSSGPAFMYVSSGGQPRGYYATDNSFNVFWNSYSGNHQFQFGGSTAITFNPGGNIVATGSVTATRYCYSATVCDYAGSGTPLGNVAAAVGSTYRRIDGGAASTFYVKESGTDANGWVAK